MPSNETLNHAAGKPRTAVVAGGAGPIGFAVLRRFCAMGMNVAVLGSSEEKARATVARLGGRADACLPLGCDVADAAAVRAALAVVNHQLGGIDVVAALQGWPPKAQPITEIADAYWHGVLQSHLTGSFHLLQHAIPYLQRSAAPRVIFFASFGADKDNCEVGLPYHVAKDGIVSLTYRAARMVADQGITVNCIATYGLHNDADGADWRAQGPCACEEITAAFCALAGEDAGAITGAVLNIQGTPPTI